MGTRQWMKYGGLAALALAALGVSTVALMPPTPPAPGAVQNVIASSPASATATPTVTTAPVKIKLPAAPRLLIVGDSYTAGEGAYGPSAGWAFLVADRLGYPSLVDGVGGTGFAWGGGAADNLGREYAVRLQEAADDASFVPNVLILQGGQNDSAAKNMNDVETETAQTIELARKLWPGIQIVVFGPSAPLPLAADMRGVNSAIRAGAATAKVPFIDASESGWFTDANSPGFDFDGSHVNTAGHRYIADKFLAAWASVTS
jgi:acyl-CoA thioesterase-1